MIQQRTPSQRRVWRNHTCLTKVLHTHPLLTHCRFTAEQQSAACRSSTHPAVVHAAPHQHLLLSRRAPLLAAALLAPFPAVGLPAFSPCLPLLAESLTVRVTVDTPSTNLVLKITLALLNMPSFRDTTMNWLCGQQAHDRERVGQESRWAGFVSMWEARWEVRQASRRSRTVCM